MGVRVKITDMETGNVEVAVINVETQAELDTILANYSGCFVEVL